jgi:ATP-binding cassette subfamily C protein
MIKTLDFYRSVFSKAPLAIVSAAFLIAASGILEGLGFTLFLPLIKALVAGEDTQIPTGLVGSVMQRAFDWIGVSSSIPNLLMMIILVFGAKNLAYYFSKVIIEKTSASFEMDLRNKIIDAVFFAEWRFFLREKLSSLLGAMEGQAARVNQAFRITTEMFTDLFAVLIFCVIGFALSWKAFLLSALGGWICFESLKRLIQKSRNVAGNTVKVRNESGGLIHENLSGLKYIKGNHLESQRKERIYSLLTRLKKSEFDTHRYMHTIDTLFDFIMAVFLAGILFISHSYFKIPGANIVLVAMVLYRINKGILRLQVKRQQLASALPSYEHCQAILSRALLAREKSGSTAYAGFSSLIKFENVTFAYDGAEVLKEVSFEIHKNRITALVGRSGSGKTTCLDLLMGLLKPQSGMIRVDGRSLGEFDIFSLRDKIGYVPQDSFLFNGTIEENIRTGNPGATRAEIVEAARLAHADEFINRLPDKYKTFVGDRGIKLSGGQRQRIALARALVRKNDILILDEATSSLDNESERMVRHAIRELKGSLTILIVAHRFSTIENADMIYVMEKGRIVESGSGEELISKNRAFADLYRAEEKHPDP